MKSKKWLIGWTIIVIVTLSIVGVIVFKIDPFFHYHKPLTEDYFYKLNNQRSQNDGIAKHFDYDAIIVGTSLTENFKTSELDELFGTKSIKIPTSGGSFKEVNDLAKTALENNQDIKIVIRGLDKWMFEDEADRMREDLGEYPEYLYDENPLNDVYYLFNKDVLFNRVGTMLNESMNNGKTGITSFDEYSRWQEQCIFGRNSVIPNGTENVELGNYSTLSEEVKKNVIENTIQNITSIADEYKDVQFYYFFSPYSIHWYKVQKELGWIYTHIEAERIIIEEILKHDNIKLFIFNDDPEIISDLNNYKDDEHYASWINSYILKCMKNG